MITTFVFDWGNVLEFIDYFGFNKHFCKTYSISLDDFRKEELNNRLKLDAGIIGLEEFFKNLEKSLNVKIDSKKYYHVRFSEYVTLNKELLRIIKKIKKQGYKLFILSNNNPLFYHHMKENLDFEKVFDKIYLSFQQKMTKSDVNFFFKLLNENNLSPNECLFIDDKQEFITIAKNLGMETVKYEKISDFLTKLKELNIKI